MLFQCKATSSVGRGQCKHYCDGASLLMSIPFEAADAMLSFIHVAVGNSIVSKDMTIVPWSSDVDTPWSSVSPSLLSSADSSSLLSARLSIASLAADEGRYPGDAMPIAATLAGSAATVAAVELAGRETAAVVPTAAEAAAATAAAAPPVTLVRGVNRAPAALLDGRLALSGRVVALPGRLVALVGRGVPTWLPVTPNAGRPTVPAPPPAPAPGIAFPAGTRLAPCDGGFLVDFFFAGAAAAAAAAAAADLAVNGTAGSLLTLLGLLPPVPFFSDFLPLPGLPLPLGVPVAPAELALGCASLKPKPKPKPEPTACPTAPSVTADEAEEEVAEEPTAAPKDTAASEPRRAPAAAPVEDAGPDEPLVDVSSESSAWEAMDRGSRHSDGSSDRFKNGWFSSVAASGRWDVSRRKHCVTGKERW
jgi:hypothetical protein